MEKKEDTKITEFFVKYKKYLSAAVLLLALIVILICCINQKGNDSTEQASGTAAKETHLLGTLEKDEDPEIVTLMQDYYKAVADAVIEDLEMIAEPFSENQKSYVQTFSDLYEEYRNITCYSAPGATDDSRVVFVSYDIKFKDVDTLAPGMDFFYVERNGKGKLYSSYNIDFMEEPLDPNLYSMILDYTKSDDLVQIQKDIQDRYEQAVASDEKLADMVGGRLRDTMTKWKASIAGDTEQPAGTENTENTQDTQKEDTQKEEDSQKEEKPEKTDKKKKNKVKTLDVCRVRRGPSTDSDIIGTVNKGVVLTKLGTEGDWTKVKFQGETGYIKSEFLKTVKSSAKSDTKEKEDSAKVKTLDICRVRKGPGTDAEILGTVDVGVELKKLGTEGDWTKVEFQGGTGYIKTEFLKAV